MARSLEKLKKQYTSVSHGTSLRGRGPHGSRAKGKPKNVGKTIARLLSYVGKYKILLVFVVLSMLISTVTSLIGSYLLAPIINRITLELFPNAQFNMSTFERLADSVIVKIIGENAPVTVYIITALIILISVYLLGVFATYTQMRLMMTVSQNSVEKIRNDLFSKLQSLPVRYFDSHPTGEIMSRFTNDVDNIDVMLNNSLVSVFSGIITLIGTFTFMISTNWILTLITVLFVPVFARLGAAIAKSSSKYYSSQQAALGAVNGYIEETVNGQKVIKVFNHEGDCVEEFSLLNGELREKQFKAQFFGGIMGPIMGNTSQISYSVTVAVGGILMVLTGFTPGALTVFAGYSRQFAMPINNISMQMSTVFAALAGAERVFNIMDLEGESEGSGKNIKREIKGEVVFENVSFGYNPDKTVLEGISLYAKKGQKIAFVGSTGAGKTTITNLLNRFYDTEVGRITIDGIDIKDYDKDFLRCNIAMVLQDTHLFTGTVMENIRYGRPEATDEEVVEAAKVASAHSFIMRLEKGYDTVIEGDGSNLSQGQRQLLNIARAALSKAPILVLDEATSSVDTRTERHIEHGMDRIMKNRTTFVIAHRLSTVRNSNAIMVLEKGRIIERGDHQALLDQKGVYHKLYTGAIELD
ncbi:MAG: ABC transporter ATP-binding protein [Acutalibacteraceae bacterium]|nr:ABC transporter ATP-binding protein [Acutalibacteraceae bacterium]